MKFNDDDVGVGKKEIDQRSNKKAEQVKDVKEVYFHPLPCSESVARSQHIQMVTRSSSELRSNVLKW